MKVGKRDVPKGNDAAGVNGALHPHVPTNPPETEASDKINEAVERITTEIVQRHIHKFENWYREELKEAVLAGIELGKKEVEKK